MSIDNQIEQEIQDKGLTAPRVTPDSIQSVIVSEHYISPAEVLRAQDVQVPYTHPLQLLTICVLVLKNGFTVVGKSACASPENFDADLGRKIARIDAVNQIWPLEGYLLKSLISTRLIVDTGA